MVFDCRYFFPFPVEPVTASCPPRVLMYGPEPARIFSLCLRYACGWVAAHSDSRALIISSKEKLRKRPLSFSVEDKPGPTLPQGLKHVDVKYIDDASQLRMLLAMIHLAKTLPGLIIIDDFPDFFGSSHEIHGQYAKTLAFIQEAADYITKEMRKRLPDDADEATRQALQCTILVTCSGNLWEHRQVLNRWLPLSLLVSEDEGKWVMTSEGSNTYVDDIKLRATYHVMDKELSFVKVCTDALGSDMAI